MVLLYLASRLDALDRPRVIAALAALLALALLTYTQSLLNFGILLPVFLALQVMFDRAPGARRRQLGLAAAGLLGVVLSLALFYARYVPVFLDMRRGVPQPEEQVLLDLMETRQRVASDAAPPEDRDDPYAGPGIDPVRGLRKAAWRLYVFYGPFALAVIGGLVLLLRGDGRRAPAPDRAPGRRRT